MPRPGLLYVLLCILAIVIIVWLLAGHVIIR
jgi:hypothetical protein